MQLVTDAVTDVLTNDSVSLRLGISRNRGTDISDAVAVPCELNAAEKRLFRRIYKRLRLGRDLSDSECVRAVSVETAVASADIYLHDVAFFKDSVLFRNAVDYLVIDADTSTAGETAVSEERRAGAAFNDIIVDDSIYFFGTDSLFYMLAPF